MLDELTAEFGPIAEFTQGAEDLFTADSMDDELLTPVHFHEEFSNENHHHSTNIVVSDDHEDMLLLNFKEEDDDDILQFDHNSQSNPPIMESHNSVGMDTHNMDNIRGTEGGIGEMLVEGDNRGMMDNSEGGGVIMTENHLMLQEGDVDDADGEAALDEILRFEE